MSDPVVITDQEYDAIYNAVLKLMKDNVVDINFLINTIKQSFNYDIPMLTDKSWYENTNNQPYKSKIFNLQRIWTSVYVEKSVERTAEILFEAWYAKINILAFHAICAAKLRGYIRDAGLDETNWFVELVDFDEKTFIKNLVWVDHMTLGFNYLEYGEHKYCEARVVFDAASGFINTPLTDILSGTWLVGLSFFVKSGSSYVVQNVPLRDMGGYTRDHFLKKIKELIIK